MALDLTAARKSWFLILHDPRPEVPWARPINWFLAALIVANCLAVAIETIPGVYRAHRPYFHALEVGSTIVFIVEYLLRIWTSVEHPHYRNPVTGRLRYALHPLLLLDLTVIATFFAPADLRFLRVFRLGRMLRVLRLDEFDHAMRAIGAGIARRRGILLVALTFMVTAVYFTAALIYAVEHDAQPENFSSVPETLWWAVITLTTIGYGDIIPITPLGKLLTGLLAILGIGVFALPTAILTAAVIEVKDRMSGACPYCGHVEETEGAKAEDAR